MAGPYDSMPDRSDIRLQRQSTSVSTNSYPDSPPKPHFRGLPARRRPKVKLWLGVIGKWSESAVIVLAVYVVLVVYAMKGVISQKQNKLFDALITAFLIALGMSTMSQLMSAVQDLKWWILSKRPRSRQKVKAMLKVSSMTETLALAFKSKRWTIHIAAAAWVSLFLAIQIGYALLGFCYSVDKNEDVALMVPGNVSVANLTTIFSEGFLDASKSSAQEYAANFYGLMGLGFDEGDLNQIPDPHTLFWSDTYFLFCNNSCSYAFRETNTQSLDDPDAVAITAFTDRKVDIKTDCSAYRVLEGGDGTSKTIVVEQDSRNTTVMLPSIEGSDRKVFMTSANQTCGKDCSVITVFEASLTDPWFYNCTVRVGSVLNAKKPEHEVGQSLAVLAASAIALGGIHSADDIKANSYPVTNLLAIPLNGTIEDLQYTLSRFATGVLASVIESNTDLVMEGQMPTIGQSLTVWYWEFVALILWFTAFIQLLVAVVATKVAERVVVPPRDSLSEAQILKAMVAEDTQDETNGEDDVPKAKTLWIYRNHHIGGGLYDLYMEEVKM
ncbi:hypothetical protein FHETE_2606 [Fusarium heterosporum]|uniref:Uncharacterized protein n=1 Tax=Fusarium heterosporum TaxID=42747 RepID=A0A8H5TVK4_FUSHE|nr:hypothetical protein FHETE_2606 [Fusarium heterosporum]